METQQDPFSVIDVVVGIILFVLFIYYMAWNWRCALYARFTALKSVVDIPRYYRAEDLIETDPEKAISELNEIKKVAEPYASWIKENSAPNFLEKIIKGCDRGIDRANKIIKKNNQPK